MPQIDLDSFKNAGIVIGIVAIVFIGIAQIIDVADKFDMFVQRKIESAISEAVPPKPVRNRIYKIERCLATHCKDFQPASHCWTSACED